MKSSVASIAFVVGIILAGFFAAYQAPACNYEEICEVLMEYQNGHLLYCKR